MEPWAWVPIVISLSTLAFGAFSLRQKAGMDRVSALESDLQDTRVKLRECEDGRTVIEAKIAFLEGTVGVLKATEHELLLRLAKEQMKKEEP